MWLILWLFCVRRGRAGLREMLSVRMGDAVYIDVLALLELVLISRTNHISAPGSRGLGDKQMVFAFR